MYQQLVVDHRYLLLCSYLHCTLHTTALIALLAIYSLPQLSFCSLTEFIPAGTCDLKYSSTQFISFIFTHYSNCLLATFSFIHNLFIIYKLPSSFASFCPLFFYFRCRTSVLESVFGRSCDRPSRHRFFSVSLCL